MPKPSVHTGKLLEMSDFGTGFIEETQTGSRFGFHISMLTDRDKPAHSSDLTGKDVQFTVRKNGKLVYVKTASVTHR